MRNAFVAALFEQAKTDEKLFLLCGDVGYSVLEPFAQAYPKRFINCGIAEQNMMLVACGLAMEGYNVFTYTIGNFATLRCMEQIRQDICYHNLNVKIVAVGSGYAYGSLGVSHHMTEDISMMRSLPNMLVCSPCDAIESRQIAGIVSEHCGPAYVRINKAGERKVHVDDVKLRKGKFVYLRHGTTTAVLSTGAILGTVLSELEKFDMDWGLVSVPFISDIDELGLRYLAKQYRHIVTVEENQLNGGFGSAILEKLNDMREAGTIKAMPSVSRIGIENEFISCAGSQEYLRRKAGLTLENLLLPMMKAA
jgi:transketolase